MLRAPRFEGAPPVFFFSFFFFLLVDFFPRAPPPVCHRPRTSLTPRFQGPRAPYAFGGVSFLLSVEDLFFFFFACRFSGLHQCLLMLHYDPRAVAHYHRALWTQCPDQNGHWAYEGQHFWLRGIHTSDKNGNAVPAQRISKFPSKFGSWCTWRPTPEKYPGLHPPRTARRLGGDDKLAIDKGGNLPEKVENHWTRPSEQSFLLDIVISAQTASKGMTRNQGQNRLQPTRVATRVRKEPIRSKETVTENVAIDASSSDPTRVDEKNLPIRSKERVKFSCNTDY